MEENQETEESRIKKLEAENHILREENEKLKLVNIKLGYSTKIMSEYHLTLDDKMNIANSMDMAEKDTDVVEIYNEYKKLLHNKALDKEGFEQFQMSQDFKDNLLIFLAVSLGDDPIASLSENIQIVKDYFDFENKIRSTPDAGQRNAMTEKLMKARPGTIEAMNNLINTINELNRDSGGEDDYEDS